MEIEEIKANIEANENRQQQEFRMQCLHVASSLQYIDNNSKIRPYEIDQIVGNAKLLYEFVKGA